MLVLVRSAGVILPPPPNFSFHTVPLCDFLELEAWNTLACPEHGLEITIRDPAGSCTADASCECAKRTIALHAMSSLSRSGCEGRLFRRF